MNNKEILQWIGSEINHKERTIEYAKTLASSSLIEFQIETLKGDIKVLESIKKDYEKRSKV